jgi:predicted DNA-binding transcriptional regulator YafY
MHYAQAERLLRLARYLAAALMRLTLCEMASELAVEQRAAERLREAAATLRAPTHFLAPSRTSGR